MLTFDQQNQPNNLSQCLILQWNCRGFSTRRQDIGHLIYEFNPICFCIQETNLKKNELPDFLHYKVLSSGGPNGCALLIRNDIQYNELTFQSSFETVSAEIRLNTQWYYVCSIYISPSKSFKRNDFEAFFNDFALFSPLGNNLIILGDFNARHPFWGDSTYNHRGVVLEDVLTPSDYCIFNTDAPTHIHIQNGSLPTFSNIVLSLCSSNLLIEMKWEVLADPHGSDHFPIVTSFLNV